MEHRESLNNVIKKKRAWRWQSLRNQQKPNQTVMDKADGSVELSINLLIVGDFSLLHQSHV